MIHHERRLFNWFGLASPSILFTSSISFAILLKHFSFKNKQPNHFISIPILSILFKRIVLI